MYATPSNGCTKLLNRDIPSNTILLIRRGDCIFLDKVIHAQEIGAKGVIILDNEPGSSIKKDAFIPNVWWWEKEYKYPLLVFVF